MRIKFVISCLMGISLVLASSTSSHFKLKLFEEVQSAASSIGTDDGSNPDASRQRRAG
jgi:hypothetical protein